MLIFSDYRVHDVISGMPIRSLGLTIIMAGNIEGDFKLIDAAVLALIVDNNVHQLRFH